MNLGILLFASLFSVTAFANINSADPNLNVQAQPEILFETEGIDEVVLQTADAAGALSPREFEHRLCVNDCNKSLSGASRIESRNSCINLCGVILTWPGQFYTM